MLFLKWPLALIYSGGHGWLEDGIYPCQPFSSPLWQEHQVYLVLFLAAGWRPEWPWLMPSAFLSMLCALFYAQQAVSHTRPATSEPMAHSPSQSRGYFWLSEGPCYLLCCVKTQAPGGLVVRHSAAAVGTGTEFSCCQSTWVHLFLVGLGNPGCGLFSLDLASDCWQNKARWALGYSVDPHLPTMCL